MLNKIMLIGNLGRDPELSYTPSGKAIAKFSLAVSRRRRDPESGEQREETTWFNIVAWERLAETCNNYLHKGSKAYIEGRMNSRKFTLKRWDRAHRLGGNRDPRWRCSTRRARLAQVVALVAQVARVMAMTWAPTTFHSSLPCVYSVV